MQIPEFRNINIMVAGDVMLDTYYTGNTSRISPEAPVPVVHIDSISEKPGGAANVALNLATLGANTCITGLVGDDEAGSKLFTILRDANIDVNFAKSTIPTTIKLRVLSRNQQLIRLDFENTNINVDFSLYEQIKDKIYNLDVLVLSDYNKGSLLHTKELIKLANEYNVRVCVDPKGNHWDKYSNAFIITPNMHEFEQIVGKVDNNQELITKAVGLIKRLRLQYLLITLSEKGAVLVNEDDYMYIPAHASEIFDVTGAGDTVVATMACCIASLKNNLTFDNLVLSAKISQIAAGVAVGSIGTKAISYEELKQKTMHENNNIHGICEPMHLKHIIDTMRQHGRKIVFTNGVFDILHAGHVHYLQQAKALGHVLIVAVNDDASVKRLKGVTRPINNLESRQIVLSGLESIDFVTHFTEDTPVNLIELFKPDVLVKGGDYQNTEEVVGHEIVEGYGGEVKVLGLIQDKSTTNILKKYTQLLNDSEAV